MSKKTKPKKTMSPRDARGMDQVRALQSDNKDWGNFWILTDGEEVTLAHQVRGEESTATIHIPRSTFNRLLAWYLKPQPLRGGR